MVLFSINDYKDQQVLVQFPPLSSRRCSFLNLERANAGEVEVWGAELDGIWTPTENLTFTANYAYTDGEFTDFQLGEIQLAATDRPTTTSNRLKAGNAEADLTGNEVPGVPDHAFSFSGKYEAPVANGNTNWFVQVSGRFQGERWADVSNLVTLDDYWIFDAQIGLSGENWEVIGYVENLADDDTVQYGQEFIDQRAGICVACGFTFPVAYYAYLPQPRVFGIRTQLKF